ncbi:MAG: type I methionyl aminopeptidase [Deltaproteobacteria bacterium]|nr:MAG: type I methionyl aminopeptidase [Deltaproteobacteria bacterium]
MNAGLIQLKSNDEIDIMRRANAVVAEVLEICREHAKPGITTGDLDRLAAEHLQRRGAGSAFLGYHGYPKHLCTSVNHRVVHGIPSDDEVLEEGDIVSCDFGAVVDGYVGDSAKTFAVGEVSQEAKTLMDVTRRALEAAIEVCRPGNRLRDIGGAVEDVVAPYGFGIVRDYVGHGIGRKMHEAPQVPNYRTRGRESALRLRPGLVIAIEPMINLGTHECIVLDDGWTVETADGKLSAHFEHSVAITEKGPFVLSDPDAPDPR